MTQRSVAVTFILVISLIASKNVQAISEISWNYTDQEFWTTVDEWDCNGQRQSPIDIDTTILATSGDLIDLVLTNFNQSYEGNFMNTGHTVQFTPNPGSSSALFQNHRGTYKLLQFHLHWGVSANQGSEHTVNGQSYSGELHFVTKKTSGADTDGDAFAVLGVLLRSDMSLSASGSYMELLNNIPREDGETNLLNEVRPADLLPSDLSYYYYEGSLTTPACSEVVQWFLLRNPVNVPSQFLDNLRSNVMGGDGDILDTSFRVTQPLNGRQVMIRDSDGAAFGLNGKWMLTFVAMITHIILFYF